MRKDILREKILKKRDSIEPQKRKEKEALIEKRLFKISEFKNAKRVLFYASFRTEVDTMNCLNSAIKLGKKIVLPKVDEKQGCLRLYETKDTSELMPGFMGILEPGITKGRETSLKDMDVVIIPGAGFDIEGNRLGYGLGYYDKLLSKPERHFTIIALAFEEQIVPKVPEEIHDVRVDKIVTDKRVIKCKEIESRK